MVNLKRCAWCMERALLLWRASEGPQGSRAGSPPGQVTPGASFAAELGIRSGKRLINGPALSTLLSLVLLSPSEWEREGICIPALAKAGEQVGTGAVEVTVFVHATCVLLKNS